MKTKDRQEILITETIGNRVDFTFAVQGVLSAEEMIKEMITKYPKLKSMEITLNGKRYKVQAIDELTLEDCTKDNCYVFNRNGKIRPFVLNNGITNPDASPTVEIAQKVQFYGLLQSVAHKLNGGNSGKWMIVYTGDRFIACDMKDLIITIDPTFATKELAEEAIRIFANSKFDLKKLFQ